jgi:hypothetical protein
MKPLKPQGEGSFTALDDCNTVGILVGILGIGIQDGYEPNDPKKDEYLLTFETPNELGADGRPYHLTKQTAISMHEKANLRILLEALNGKKLPDDKIKFTGNPADDLKTAAFITKIISGAIGKACLIDVVKYTKQNGYDGNKISAFSKLPKGMEAGKALTTYGYFDLDAPDWALFEKFPQWQRDTCNKDSYSNTFNGSSDDIPFDDDEGDSNDDDSEW